MLSRPVIERQINQRVLTQKFLEIGSLVTYDPYLQRCVVRVSKPGHGDYQYGNLTLPSFGSGTRLGQPRSGDTVVLGFLSGLDALPVILAVLTGSINEPSRLPDLSQTPPLGRLGLSAF